MPPRPFRISLVEHGHAATLYALQFLDAPGPELSAFLAREALAVCDEAQRATCLDDSGDCRDHCLRPEYRPLLLSMLEEATETEGFRVELFRPFDPYRYPTCAMQAGVYRLFGIRFETDIFIAGGGGPKFVRRDEEDPILDRALRDVEQAARRLRKRMRGRGLDHPPRDKAGRLYLPDDILTFA